jgi:hypothetical protein
VIVLRITLLSGGETMLRSDRYHHIVVCIMIRARENSLCAGRRRNKTVKLREQKDSKRRDGLFGSLPIY